MGFKMMSNSDAEVCWTEDIKLQFKQATWPRIDPDALAKLDIKRSFDLFDVDGLGLVTVDAVKVALHALGHDLSTNERKALRCKFPENKIDFNEYLKILKEWMLNIDSDEDIAKAFETIDKDAKGYINLQDLQRIRNELGYTEEITDAELADMLLGSQHTDVATELEQQYEARQQSTRHRKGQGYASQEVDMGPLYGLPYGITTKKRTSSEMQVEPEDLVVNFSNFRRILQLNDLPAEPI